MAPHVTTKVLFFLRREPAQSQYMGISASVTEKSRKASDTWCQTDFPQWGL